MKKNTRSSSCISCEWIVTWNHVKEIFEKKSITFLNNECLALNGSPCIIVMYIQIVDSDNIRWTNNGYYIIVNTGVAQREAVFGWWEGGGAPEICIIPGRSHVAVHSPQTTYLDPINPGSSVTLVPGELRIVFGARGFCGLFVKYNLQFKFGSVLNKSAAITRAQAEATAASFVRIYHYAKI